MQTLQSYYIVIFAILNLEEATNYYQTIMVKVYIIWKLFLYNKIISLISVLINPDTR